MQRKIVFAEGEYYHVYNRGVDQREIFLGDQDYERFLKLLYVSNGNRSFKFRDIQNIKLDHIDRGEPLVAIGAYALMPNHFHILVKEIQEGGISQFMGKLTTSYSMYFNTISERTGALFEGRFKAQHVDNDEYMKYLYAYIHLNPVKLIEPKWKDFGLKNKGGAKKFLEQYRYSSYPEYTQREREEKLTLTKDEFPDYFSINHEFADFVHDWLAFRESASS